MQRLLPKSPSLSECLQVWHHRWKMKPRRRKRLLAGQKEPFVFTFLASCSLSLSLLAFVCHWGRSEDDTKAEKKDKKEKKKDKKAKKASCWCLLYQLSSNDSIIFYPTCITSERQQRNWRRWRRKLLRRCGILNQQLIDTAYRAYRHCYCFPSFGQKEKKAKKEAKLLQIERAMQELQTKCPI